MEALPPVKGAVPHSVRIALDHLMPESGLPYRLKRRVSGLGSLGRPPFIALADWQGVRLPVRRKPWGSPPVCGQERTMDPTPSSISLYWRLFGAKILLCGYKVAGLYDGSPPTARALNCPHCRKNEMRPISCTRWAGRRRTCIWGSKRRSELCSETSPHESPNGCIGLRNRWQVQQSATGRSAEKPNPASREVLAQLRMNMKHWIHLLSLISRQGESPYSLSQYWISFPMGFELT